MSDGNEKHKCFGLYQLKMRMYTSVNTCKGLSKLFNLLKQYHTVNMCLDAPGISLNSCDVYNR